MSVRISNMDIEYVGDKWIHFHSNFGMMSIYIKPIQLKSLTTFLLSGYFLRSKPAESAPEIDIKIGRNRFILQGPDEDRFNWFIDSGEIRIIIGMDKKELIDLIDYFKNPED